MNEYTLAQLPAAYCRAQATNRRRYVTPHPVDIADLQAALAGRWAQQRDAWIDLVATALHARIPACHLARNTETVWEYGFYILGQDWERPDCADQEEAAAYTAKVMATIRWWYAWQRGDFPALDYTQAALAAWLADYAQPQRRLF